MYEERRSLWIESLVWNGGLNWSCVQSARACQMGVLLDTTMAFFKKGDLFVFVVFVSPLWSCVRHVASTNLATRIWDRLFYYIEQLCRGKLGGRQTVKSYESRLPDWLRGKYITVFNWLDFPRAVSQRSSLFVLSSRTASSSSSLSDACSTHRRPVRTLSCAFEAIYLISNRTSTMGSREKGTV